MDVVQQTAERLLHIAEGVVNEAKLAEIMEFSIKNMQPNSKIMKKFGLQSLEGISEEQQGAFCRAVVEAFVAEGQNQSCLK